MSARAKQTPDSTLRRFWLKWRFHINVLLLLVPVVIGFVWWLEWRRYGDFIDGKQIYVREGWWRERMSIASQVKVQTVEIYQGPIARRQGLASVNFGISGGSLEMIALPLETAHAIRDAVMEQVAAVDYAVVAGEARLSTNV